MGPDVAAGTIGYWGSEGLRFLHVFVLKLDLELLHGCKLCSVTCWTAISTLCRDFFFQGGAAVFPPADISKPNKGVKAKEEQQKNRRGVWEFWIYKCYDWCSKNLLIMKVSFTGMVIIQAVCFGLIVDRDNIFWNNWVDYVMYFFSSLSFLSMLTQWLMENSYDHLEHSIFIDTFITILRLSINDGWKSLCGMKLHVLWL